MAIPSTAPVAAQPMDPYDLIEYAIDCSNLLASGENISTWTVTALPETTLLGLQIQTTAGYAASLSGKIITIWLNVITAEQGNPAFTTGVVLPFELSFTTSNNPARKKQRTFGVRVVQQ
jgi:hypothetical protein